jgi:protein CpxP
MNSLKFWKIFAVILVALNIGLVILHFLKPDQPFNGNGPGEGNTAKFLIENLKFSEEQKATFEILKNEHRDSMMKLNSMARTLRKDFFEGLKSDEVGSNRDLTLQLIIQNQCDKEMLTYTHFEKVKKICSFEQKKIFITVIEEAIEKLQHKPPQRQFHQ